MDFDTILLILLVLLGTGPLVLVLLYELWVVIGFVWCELLTAPRAGLQEKGLIYPLRPFKRLETWIKGLLKLK